MAQEIIMTETASGEFELAQAKRPRKMRARQCRNDDFEFEAIGRWLAVIAVLALGWIAYSAG